MSPRREFGMKGEAIYPIGATEPVVMQAGPDAVRVSPPPPRGRGMGRNGCQKRVSIITSWCALGNFLVQGSSPFTNRLPRRANLNEQLLLEHQSKKKFERGTQERNGFPMGPPTIIYRF